MKRRCEALHFNTMNTSIKPKRMQIIIAFAVLYIVWGSTYLGIKVAVETMPPLLMAAARFIPAGAILFMAALWIGKAPMPRKRDWVNSFIIGSALILGGNGLVTIAERTVDSTLAAVLIASNPIFIAIFATLAKVQKAPSRLGVVSLFVGFLGVCLLVYSKVGLEFEGELGGVILLFSAIVSWTLGTVFSKSHPTECSPFMMAGMQMFFGGILCLLAAFIMGELGDFDISLVSNRSWFAYWYLLFVGSLAGFTSFVYLLTHCSPSAVSSHAYINPLVALLLGWLILGETFNWQGWLSALIILLSVFILLGKPRK